MDYRLLVYFLAVCDELHFTKAAEKLGISQPTLSQQIRLLEDRVGSPLFQRIGKKVYLTEAGVVLQKHSRNVFHELEQAQTAMNELQGMQRGRLRIGCSGNHLLTSTIMSFHAQYPNIELSVTELATEETKERLLNNRLDVGVVFLPEEDEQLHCIPLYTERLVLAVSDRHPFAVQGVKAIKLEELVKLPIAMLPGKFYVRHMIEDCCKRAGLTCKPIVEMSTLESLLQMARQNVCGAIVPQSYVTRTDVNSGAEQCWTLAITDPVPQKDVGIVYRRDLFISRTLDAFVRQVTQDFQDAMTRYGESTNEG
ncbi:LysR family transcriptional regulator [Paenibacillus whitsoniae]|uniref:LysR family transcriptional regulator n=1 Tax=Paenibacillus whitsoniae TaxID=2496558 RepID=A0A3S0A384_9BACL|nr:LysR substrate-binding domain-containing protein [Paenibacillus whitsoniae]RTE08478.1 LysR family transcriptional regulator [Paenibacillus whitsoniae]